MNAVSRFLDSDLFYSFRRTPSAVISAIVAAVIILGAAAAPWVAPYNPFDLASLDLMDAFNPPAFMDEGSLAHPFGTDDQGRDVLSAILYGARVSLVVGVSATAFALAVGVLVGLLAGYAGGTVDAVLMRIADIQLTFPSILIALLIDGVARAALARRWRHSDRPSSPGSLTSSTMRSIRLRPSTDRICLPSATAVTR